MMDKLTFGQWVLFYTLCLRISRLCGYNPFSDADESELLRKIKYEPAVFEEEHWNQISQEAKDLVCKMLVKEPSERIKIDEIEKHAWFELDKKEELPFNKNIKKRNIVNI